MITQEQVRELFDYKDGALYWKIKKQGVTKGIHAGYKDNINGYRPIEVNKEQYKEHQLIFIFHKGYLPKEIDHKNLDKSNSRIENLREATRSQNKANTLKYKNNKSGHKGVCWHRRDKTYRSQITVNRKVKHLGCFDDPIEAAKAYNTAAIKYFGEFARLNSL